MDSSNIKLASFARQGFKMQRSSLKSFDNCGLSLVLRFSGRKKSGLTATLIRDFVWI